MSTANAAHSGITNHCHPHGYAWDYWPGYPTYPQPLTWTWTAPAQQQVPHKCPVCKGRCERPAAFYGLPGQHQVECRSCKGSGVVWQPV